IEFGKVQEHLDLAEWCLRQGLLHDAAAELRDAIAADPTHPKIALVERRLRLAAERPNAGKPSSAPPTGTPSPDELDRMARGMPSGTLETFTSAIQPLLLNHCSTAACHGPQSTTKFRLLRVPVDRVASRRSTQRNLYAV